MGSIVVMCYFYQGWKASHKAYLWTIFERCEYVDTVHGQRREPAYFSFFCTTRVSSGCPENGISPWKKQVLMNVLCVAFFPPDCALHMCSECIQIKWWTLMMKILKKLSFLILKTFQVQVQKGKQTNSCVCNFFFPGCATDWLCSTLGTSWDPHWHQIQSVVLAVRHTLLGTGLSTDQTPCCWQEDEEASCGVLSWLRSNPCEHTHI